MDLRKEQELKTNQNRALAFLGGAALLFLITAFLPPGFWVSGIKAVAEAALVGALADWFAVTALFHRIGVPGTRLSIPFITRHTAIIPNNKARIADELAWFVRDRFLDQDSLVALIRKHDPAGAIAAWLSAPGNTRLMGHYLVRFASGMLELTDDARIQEFIRNALRSLVRKLDLSQSAASLLQTLTKDGRHQQLLDEGLAHLAAQLREPEVRALVAHGLVDWLKREHPTIERILPSNWAGRSGAEMLSSVVDKVLAEVGNDPEHALRRKFDDTVQRLIERLRQDPDFIARADGLKHSLLDGELVNAYIKELWEDLRAWLKRDLASEDSSLHTGIVEMGNWLGRELSENAPLRQSLNEHLENAARAMGPDFTDFLTHHISDTVKNWDAREMSRHIELNIGKDLQYIRINGTLVGGLIGLLLYLGSRGIEALSPYVR